MADGKVLIDTKLDTSGVKKGTEDLKDELEELAKVTSKVADKMEDELGDAGKSAEKSADSFGALFKANLSADLVTGALREMGDAAVELGKQAVTAAAEINASNAQFEQTFKGIETVARNSLNKVANEAGITATRMQDSYTSIFAFSKSIGAEQEQALDISARAMAAAADSAAYYDKSIEEATETLQSFLKGNYENDAALGIAATETTRNAKANQMYAKSFQELSEAQKVDVLLAMVEAGNEASGALGQAAREADSWTNVLGELQEAWRLLLGVMGDPILEGLIPVIQGITEGIQKLIQTTASAELTENMESFRDTISDINSEFDRETETIEKNALMADYYKGRLEELEEAGLNTAGAQQEYAHAVEALNDIYPELNLQLNEQTGLLDENSRAQLANVEAMKQKALFAAMESQYTDALTAQAEAVLAVQAAKKSLAEIEADRAVLQEQLTAATGMEANELIRLYSSQMNAATGYVEMSGATESLTREQMDLVRQMIELDTETRNVQQGIDESKESIAEYDLQIKEMSETMQSWADQQSQSVEQTSQATQQALGETSAAAEEAANAFDESFAEPTQESAEATGAAMEESLTNPADTMEEAWKDEAKWFDSNVETPIKTSTEEMGQTMLSTLADMEAENDAAWERMVQAVESAIDQMQRKINSLQGKSVNVGVNSTDPNYSSLGPRTAGNAAWIPAVATGTVIPPLAVGSASRTTNLDEETVNVMAGKIAGVMSERAEIIEVLAKLEVGGDMGALVRTLYPEFTVEATRQGKNLATILLNE